MTPTVVADGLTSPDPEQRRAAVAKLRALPGRDAVQLLLRAMGDEDWRVRKEATEVAMALAPDADVLRGLMETLSPGEDNVGLRNAAVEALGAYGVAAVDALHVALSTLDSDGRKLAAEALGLTAEPAALLALRTLISDPDPNVSAAAAEAMAAIGAARIEDVAPVLEGCLTAEDSFLRLTALNGLNQLSVVLEWGLIQDLATDPVLEPAALLAAGRNAHPEAATLLVAGLTRPRRSTRVAALRALVDFVRSGPAGLRGARAALSGLDQEAHARIIDRAGRYGGALDERRSALILLGALGSAEAARTAVDALSDGQVAPEAEEALMAMGEACIPALIERMGRVDARELAVVIELAGQLAGMATHRAVVDALRPALQHTEPGVVEAALTALARVGDDGSLRVVSDVLAAEDPKARRSAVAALRAIARRYPDAARGLAREALPDGPVALAAVVITGALSGPIRECVEDDVRFLSEALSAEQTLVRRAALDALAGLRDARAIEAVAFALTDEEGEVRRAAAHALGAMRSEKGEAGGVDQLLKLISQNPERDLLVAAIAALGEAGDSRALDVLRPLVTAAEPLVAVHAVEALGLLRDPRRGEALAAALSHRDAEVAKAALQMMVDDGEANAYRHLVACLEHPGWDVRRLAADLLGRAGGAVAMAPLRARLAFEKEPLVREALHRAVMEIESADVALRRTTPPPSRQR